MFRREIAGAGSGSFALLAGALAFQYIGGLAPCSLCLLQRWPHVVAVLLAALMLAVPIRPLALVGVVAMLVSTGLGFQHVGVERGWWEGPTTCATPDPGSMDAGALLEEILRTPVVLCDQVSWSLLGISMAGWNAIASLALAALWLRAYASSSASQ